MPWTLALYSDGTANGGKQITGLATAVPIRSTPASTAASIAPTATIWQTKTYDAHTGGALSGQTQVTSTTIRPMLNYIMTKQSRGKDYADLLIMSPEHYAAYDAATIAIQRQQNETSLGKLGFSALEYIGGGKRAEIVLDGGIGSNMPANTTFGLNTDTLPASLSPQQKLRQAVRWRRPDADRQGRDRSVHRLDGRTHDDQSAVQLADVRQRCQAPDFGGWIRYPACRNVGAAVVGAAAAPVRSTSQRTRSMATKDPDDSVVALFKEHAVKNEAKSAAEGRPIFDDDGNCRAALARLQELEVYPGHRVLALGRPIRMTGEQVKVTYAERFRRQYQQFKSHATADQERHAAATTRRS